MEKALCPVLVGREEELTALEDSLLAAHRGGGQIVLLSGEAGMGKTRLATELQQRALKIGMTVLWGGCSEADLALPYLPFLEAIGNYLTTASLDSVRQRLGPMRMELARLFPQLDPGTALAEQGDPTQAKLRLFEAIMGMLRLAAGEKGLLLVIEDLHWSDASTRELLEYMTRRLSGVRVMVLATFRSDELHRKHPLAPLIQGWRRTRAVQVVELEPLSLDGVGQMVGWIFDSPEVTPEFSAFLFRRSEGNPFVLEEFLKAALDRGDIYRGPQKWERKALTELRLPQTVKDTILLRLERMSAEQAEILQTAAVLGPSWNYRTLVTVTERDDGTVQAALHASIQQQLLEEDPGGNGRYRFRHALTRESIYDDMIAPRREQLHARAAAMLAQLPGTRPAELAYHLFAANRWSEAVPVGIKAAEEAERSWAYREAADLYQRLLSHVEEDLTRGQLLCRLGYAHYQLIDPARAQRYLEQGIPLLERLGQHRDAAHYRLVLGRCFWERSQPAVARSFYEQARRELEAQGPSDDLATAYVRLAGLELFDSRYEACVALATRAVEVAEQVGAEIGAIWGRLFIGSGLCGMGRTDEGLALMDESRRQAMARGDYLVARNALHNSIVRRFLAFRAKEVLGLLSLYEQTPGGFFAAFDHGGAWEYLGFPEKALPFFEKALEFAREGESSTGENWIHVKLAGTMSALGRHDEAIAMMPALASQHEMQDIRLTLQHSIQIHLAANRLDLALADSYAVFGREHWGSLLDRRQLLDPAVEAFVAGGSLEQAERLVKSCRADSDDHDPYQDRMEGRLALALGRTDEARNRLKAALRRFEEADYGIEIMATLRALAEAELAGGHPEGSIRELERAVQLATERGAAHQREAAVKRLAELGVESSPAQPAMTSEPVELSERLVTVLFLDIRGYTSFAAHEAPDRLADTLGNLYRWARHEIERHNGLIDKYEGDAVMATFNVTGARLDHPVQALQAAIAIRDKAATAGIPVGAAIAVGPAIVGKLAADSPISTYGEVTNLASRLQGHAGAGEIVLSDEAHRRVRAFLEERKVTPAPESVAVKGYAQPIVAYRLRETSPSKEEGGDEHDRESSRAANADSGALPD